MSIMRSVGAWAAAAGLALLLTACDSSDDDPVAVTPPPPPPAVQFGTAQEFPPINGVAVGQALGLWDGDGDLDSATISGNTLVVAQNGEDALTPVRLTPQNPGFTQTETMITLNNGQLFVAANAFGTARFVPPFPAAGDLPPADEQDFGPFPIDIEQDAKMAQGTVAGVNVVAVPGSFDGPITGVLLYDADTCEAAGLAENFLNTAGLGINNPSAVCLGDFDGDGDTDVAVSGNSEVAVFLQDGVGTFNAGTLVNVANLANDVTCGQFDAGPGIDLAVATNQGIEVFLNGAFANPAGFGIQFGFVKEVHAGDVTLDTPVDLYGIFGPGSNETIFVSPGTGAGGFGPAVPGFAGDDAGSDLRNIRAGNFFSTTTSTDFTVVRRTGVQSHIVAIPQLP